MRACRVGGAETMRLPFDSNPTPNPHSNPNPDSNTNPNPTPRRLPFDCPMDHALDTPVWFENLLGVEVREPPTFPQPLALILTTEPNPYP